MIYEPRNIFRLTDNWGTYIGIPLFGVLIGIIADFLAGENKPWEYYLGAALGGMAFATGIPGAAAVMYVAGDTVDGLLFHSEEGSHVRVFLDGIQHADIFTYAATEAWEAFQASIPDDGQIHQLAFVNMGVAPGNTSGIAWMALGGPITVTGDNPVVLGVYDMPIAEFSFSLVDASGNPSSLNIKAEKTDAWTVADGQEFINEFVPLLDAVVGGEITAASMALPATLPGGIKATPEASSHRDHTASLQFLVDNGARRSVTIPQISHTRRLAADGLNMGDSDGLAFLAAFTTGLDISGETTAPVHVVGTDSFAYTQFLRGKTY